MEWIEVTGRTLDEARERALDELGVHEDELEVEVLEEGRSRLLGMVRTDARIRARVRPVSREKPDDRRRKGGSGGRGEGSRGGRSGSRSRERGGSREGARDRAAPSEAAPAGAREEAGGSGSRRRRGGRGRSGASGERPAGAQRPPRAGGADRNDENGGSVERESDMPIGEQRDVAVEFLQGILEAVELGADVVGDVDEDDGVIQVRVEGGDLGLLIGPKAATLDAVEELTRSVVQRAAGGGSARVRVDVGGYRERRREALRAFTMDLVARVRETGAAQALEPMGAPDRKVVHDVVAELDDVETVSEGEDPRRRVVITPAE